MAASPDSPVRMRTTCSTAVTKILPSPILPVFALYGAFAARMRERVLSSPTAMAWLRRSFAATFVALGAKLALTQR